MDWIDLGNPVPRTTLLRHTPLEWPHDKQVPLPANPNEASRSLAEVLSSRRSKRDYSTPTLEKLAQLFSLSSRVRDVLSSAETLPQSIRPAPSAGALHPIHIILHRHGEHHWDRYDPYTHSLWELRSATPPSIVRTALQEVLPGDGATLLLFAAEPKLTFAKYEQACSLIWRDAGVLQGFLSLAAEALGLNFCLMGVTGEPWVSGLVEQNSLIGVGAAYVGAPR
jgi:SagB-type dehydrogenase family enzyme